MRARVLLNLALALLVGALALVVWLRPGRPDQPPPEPLTTLTPDAIDHIAITPALGESFALERAHGAWQVVAGDARVLARQYRVDALLGVAGTPRRAALSEGAAADFGLDPPQARLRLNTTEIAFGDSNPVDYRRYVRVGGTTYLIDDHYFHHLSTTWAGWADLRLVPPGATLESVTTPSYSLTATPAGGYTISPANDQISADALALRAQDWTALQAVETHAGRPVPADTTELVLTFRAPDADAPTTLRFALERQAGAVLAHRTDIGLSYEIAAAEADRLLRPPAPDAPLPTDDAKPAPDAGPSNAGAPPPPEPRAPAD